MPKNGINMLQTKLKMAATFLFSDVLLCLSFKLQLFPLFQQSSVNVDHQRTCMVSPRTAELGIKINSSRV